MVVVFHHHSPVWVHHSPVWERNLLLHPLHPLHRCSSNGTSKHLSLITKAAARDHNKSKKQWGNSPTFDLFFPYETSQEESKRSDVAHMNPLFQSPAPTCLSELWLHLTVAAPVTGGLRRGVSQRQLDHIWADPLEDTARSGRQRVLVQFPCLSRRSRFPDGSVIRNKQPGSLCWEEASGRPVTKVFCVIHNRPPIIKTEGGRHVKKEWPWSATSAERSGSSAGTGVWELSDEVQIEKADTHRPAKTRTQCHWLTVTLRFDCCQPW